MSAGPRYEVLWTETALQMIEDLGDRRIQQQLFDISKQLETDPDKQGKPLREDLMGYRSLRVAGQRYRLIYAIDSQRRKIQVVAAGLRREGAREDIYELAQKLVRLGLAPSGRPRPTRDASVRKRK